MFAHVFDDALMARAYVELPEGWGPSQVILVKWRNAGYQADRLKRGRDEADWLIFNRVIPRHTKARRLAGLVRMLRVP